MPLIIEQTANDYLLLENGEPLLLEHEFFGRGGAVSEGEATEFAVYNFEASDGVTANNVAEINVIYSIFDILEPLLVAPDCDVFAKYNIIGIGGNLSSGISNVGFNFVNYPSGGISVDGIPEVQLIILSLEISGGISVDYNAISNVIYNPIDDYLYAIVGCNCDNEHYDVKLNPNAYKCRKGSVISSARQMYVSPQLGKRYVASYSKSTRHRAVVAGITVCQANIRQGKIIKKT